MNFVKGIPPKMCKDLFGMYTGGANRAGWHGECKIRYCPMCGRDLLVK